MKNVLEFLALWLGGAVVATALVGSFAYFFTPFLNKLFWGYASPEDLRRRTTSVR